MTDNDDSGIDHIPPIIPARDEVVSRQAARQNSRPRGKKSVSGGGAGLLARLFIVISLVVAAVACAWAWQLQQELDATVPVLALYEERISDLEDRLSDTDEGMNQSAVTLGVKIKELASEVDKLWASAWRRNKAKIAELEKSSSAHGSQLSTLAKTDSTYSTQLQSLATDIQKLRSVAGDLEQLVASAKSNQALLEQLGDDVSRSTLEIARLQKRLQTGEEWQASVDGFRKQVNKSLIRLQKSLGELQGGTAPSAPPTTN
jgi:chromosome segregation ATPase